MFEQIATPTNLLIISGLILVMLELFIGIEAGFDLVLIGSILVISGAVGGLTDQTLGSFILASVLSVVYIFFGRKIVKKSIAVSTNKSNIDQLIGKVGLVTKDVSADNTGSITINQESWRAASEESIATGEKAEVVSVEGVTLQIKRI